MKIRRNAYAILALAIISLVMVSGYPHKFFSDIDVEPCPFESIELDFTVSKNNPYPSPFDRTVDKQSTTNGLEAKVSLGDLGHDPQFILGSPESLSVSRGDTVNVRYAQCTWGTGEYLSQLTIVDAIHNSIIAKVQLPASKYPPKKEKCIAYFNGGCSFSVLLGLSHESLTVGSYYLFMTNDQGADSHPIFFNIKPAIEDTQYEYWLVYPELTWQAYNRSGGGSLYYIFKYDEAQKVVTRFQFSPNTRTYSSSLARPMLVSPTGRRRLWTQSFARALFSSANDIRFDTSVDLENIGISRRII